MKKFFFASNSLDDVVSSKFGDSDYIKIYDYKQLHEKLIDIEKIEPLRFGFVLDCSKKGFGNDILFFLTEFVPILGERTFQGTPHLLPHWRFAFGTRGFQPARSPA